MVVGELATVYLMGRLTALKMWVGEHTEITRDYTSYSFFVQGGERKTKKSGQTVN